MTLCAKQDSCPVLLAAIEAKVEAESKARVAKSEMAAAIQAFDPGVRREADVVQRVLQAR